MRINTDPGRLVGLLSVPTKSMRPRDLRPLLELSKNANTVIDERGKIEAAQRYRRTYEVTKRKQQPKTLTKFCGIDGEGGNVNGRHLYYLLRAGGDYLHTGGALTASECLSFIGNLPKNRIYISFFFNYDV